MQIFTGGLSAEQYWGANPSYVQVGTAAEIDNVPNQESNLGNQILYCSLTLDIHDALHTASYLSLVSL